MPLLPACNFKEETIARRKITYFEAKEPNKALRSPTRKGARRTNKEHIAQKSNGTLEGDMKWVKDERSGSWEYLTPEEMILWDRSIPFGSVSPETRIFGWGFSSKVERSNSNGNKGEGDGTGLWLEFQISALSLKSSSYLAGVPTIPGKASQSRRQDRARKVP